MLGKTEIGQLQMTLGVEQNILGLQIPVDDLLIVQIFKSAHDLSRIKHGRFRLELVSLSKQTEQLATGHIFQQHVQVLLVVIGPEEFHDKRMIFDAL